MQDWLAHRARATPGTEALVNAGSGNSWSYATLDETVEEMAGRLHALGVKAGDHLAAVLGTGVETVCLVHAGMRLGATLVPLSPEFTPPELRERFERADADAVVCEAGTEGTVRAAAEGVEPWLDVLTIDETEWGDAEPLADADPVAFSPAGWDRDDVQLLLFTSGTTGEAKAVQLTMGNLLASATSSAFRLGLDPEDRWLVPLSLHHMGGIAPVLRSTLYGTTAIVRTSFDPGGTVDDLRSYDATCVSLVPTMLRRMLDARGTLPDSLRFVLVGGAPCPEELIDRCRDFSVPVCPTYGMTETASQVATARHREAYETPSTVGQPLLWTDVTVVDEAGSPVDPGETGELVVQGPTVTPGYYGDHAATGEAIGPHGLHTGDVGQQDEEGRLYVLNRLDDRILTGGENVDPGEVIDAIGEHSAVRDTTVVGLPDEEWGEQVAALVVAEDEELDAATLEPFLRDRLAGFKIPRTLAFVEELPRTVSGTVEREAVRERLAEGETQHIERTGTSGRAATDTGSARAAAREEGEHIVAEPDSRSARSDAESQGELDSVKTADRQEAQSTYEAEPPTAAEGPEAGPAAKADSGLEDEQPALEGGTGDPERQEIDADVTDGAESSSAATVLDDDGEEEGMEEPVEPVSSEGESDRPAEESSAAVGRAVLDEEASGNGDDLTDPEGNGNNPVEGEPDGEDPTGRVVDDEASGQGLQDLVERDSEETGEEEGLRGLAERATAEGMTDEARKGGSALASEADTSERAELVEPGAGAALGTGRGSSAGSAGQSEADTDSERAERPSEQEVANGETEEAEGETENETGDEGEDEPSTAER